MLCKKEILENKVIKRNCSEFFGAVLFMTCASGGVHFFGIFHRKREKALVEFQGLGADRDQHHRAAALHPDRAVGLIGQTAAFKNDFLAAHLGCDPGGIENILQHM